MNNIGLRIERYIENAIERSEQCQEVEELYRDRQHQRNKKIKELTHIRKWNKDCVVKKEKRDGSDGSRLGWKQIK